MTRTQGKGLSRREREIMDVLYREGEATAVQVRSGLSDPPSYSAVRAHLRILEEKGHARHRSDGPRYVYAPVVSRRRARTSAMRDLVRTFFDGSPAEAVSALLGMSSTHLSEAELDEITRLIEDARKEDR